MQFPHSAFRILVALRYFTKVLLQKNQAGVGKMSLDCKSGNGIVLILQAAFGAGH